MLKLKPLVERGRIIAVFAVALFVGILLAGFVRKVPVVAKVEPANAVITVNGNPVKNGDKVGFGTKFVEVNQAGYTPYQTAKKLGIFSTLALDIKLRQLPTAAKLADGDYLRHDRTGNVFLRSGGRLHLVSSVDKTIPITDERFGSLTEIAFSPDGLLAWVRFADQSNGIYDFNRYDLANQEFHRWDDGGVAAAWLPSSSAGRPDRQRLVYLKDGSLFKTDPLRAGTERLIDLSKEGIARATLEWSFDERVLMIVSNGNLYFLEPQTKTLSKVASGGVTSAQLSPDATAVIFTQNGQLFSQKFSLVDPFSGNPQDVENIGKVLVEPATPLNLLVEASDGTFRNNDQLVFPMRDQGGPGLNIINLSTGSARPLYHQLLPGKPAGLRLFGHTVLIFEANGSIYSLAVDDGVYL